MKILIVEDDNWQALEIETWLTDEGYEVTDIVESGEDAINSIKENCPDLMLVDIKLKGKLNDGILLMEELSKRTEIAHIYMTGETEAKLMKRFEAAKFTKPAAFIPKLEMRQDSLLRAIDLALFSVEEARADQENCHVVNKAVFFYGGQRDNRDIKFLIAEIAFLEADGGCTKVYTCKQGKLQSGAHIICMGLGLVTSKILEHFPNFLRINNKYTVNLDHVTAIRRDDRCVEVCHKRVPKAVSQGYDIYKRFLRIHNGRD